MSRAVRYPAEDLQVLQGRLPALYVDYKERSHEDVFRGSEGSGRGGSTRAARTRPLPPLSRSALSERIAVMKTVAWVLLGASGASCYRSVEHVRWTEPAEVVELRPEDIPPLGAPAPWKPATEPPDITIVARGRPNETFRGGHIHREADLLVAGNKSNSPSIFRLDRVERVRVELRRGERVVTVAEEYSPGLTALLVAGIVVGAAGLALGALGIALDGARF